MFRSLRTNSISVTFQGATLSNSLNFLCLGLLSISKMIKKWTLGCFTELCTLSCFSHVWLSVTLWTVACQAPMSTGFSRQESWSGLPRPSPGDLPDSGIEPASLASPAHTKHLTSPQSKQEWKKLELRDQRIRACTLLTMTSWQMFGWLQNHPRSHRIYKENPL